MPIFLMVFQLTISVSNTNEHYPVCTQQLFTFFIPRSIQTRVSFGQVLATDADVGDRVEYYIDGNNGGKWLTAETGGSFSWFMVCFVVKPQVILN